MLDKALDLEPLAQEAFLDSLPVDKARKVRRLLGHADAGTIDAIARDAQRVVEHLAPASSSPTAGRWRLKHELGSGGMGQVWLGVRDEADYVQKAAIKVLWSHRADTEFKDRFLRERQILATLEHPGISRLLDGGLLADGRPWFAMEFVDGPDIVSHCKHRPLRERLTLFVEVCAALQYAHERLIIHRDIKPANILVDDSGRPRLLDFGVATILGALPDTKTRTGGSPLTLQYASPEQVSGEPMTVGSDIYQLGLLLYELTTGTLPYELADASLSDAIRLITVTPLAAPRDRNAAVSADLSAIVLKALAKDVRHRYRSVAEFADDVGRVLNGYPVTARPPSQAYAAWRFARRNAVVVTLASVFVVGLAAATAVSVKLAQDARAEAERSAKTQQVLASVFEQANPYGDGAGKDVRLADGVGRGDSRYSCRNSRRRASRLGSQLPAR